MRECLRVTWTVTPVRPPVAWRHCSHCSGTRRFRTSEKFRVNAQKKRIDVWLVYRCEFCETSWNLPILERVMVSGIQASTLSGFMQNAEGLARRYAFDLERLRHHGARIEACPDFLVSKAYANGCRREPKAIEIILVAPESCEIRLDQLLARELGVSRSSIARYVELEAIAVIPATRKGLRAMLANGQAIRFTLESIDDAVAATFTRAALEGASRASP